MISKVWKVFKEVALGAILLLTLSLVISGALKNAGIIEKPGFFIALGVFLKKIEFGSVTDWLSAVCNIIMAYAAYRAFVFAKDYFSDFVKKDGYDLVKKLQLELIPEFQKNLHLSSINVLDTEVPSYVAGGVGIFQDEDEVSQLPQTLSADLRDLQARLKKSHQLEREIKETLVNLEVYGWEMLPRPKEQLMLALAKNNILFIHIQNIVVNLAEILSRDAPAFMPTFDEKFFRHFDPVTNNSPPCYQEVDVLVSKIIKIHRELYDHQKNTPYTETIEATKAYFYNGRHLKMYFKHISD